MQTILLLITMMGLVILALDEAAKGRRDRRRRSRRVRIPVGWRHCMVTIPGCSCPREVRLNDGR